MHRLTLIGLSFAATLVAACAPDGSLLSIMPVFPVGSGGASPAPGPSGPCELVQVVPAPLFHVAFTSPASAGATVSLEPWVFLQAPIMKHDEVLPETFAATVDEQKREIVVTGKVRATRPNPEAMCAYPAIYTFPKAATLSLPVVLQATGTYVVRIASESFTTDRPDAIEHPSQPPRVYPEPAATRSLVID